MKILSNAGIPLSILLTLTFAVSATSSYALANSSSSNNKTRTLFTKQFDTWSYTAFEEQDSIVLDIELPATNTQSLEKYARANEELARSLFSEQDEIEANIIFKRPLKSSALPQIMNEHRDQIQDISFRVKSGKGERITVFGTPGEYEVIDSQEMGYILQQINEKMGYADFIGATNINMLINEEQYDALLSHPNVRMIEVVAYASKKDYMDNNSSSTEISINPAPTYWYYSESGE